jgi:hypothetical protein
MSPGVLRTIGAKQPMALAGGVVRGRGHVAGQDGGEKGTASVLLPSVVILSMKKTGCHLPTTGRPSRGERI